MTDNEKLIEEAAISIREADGALSHGEAMLYADTALAVFEKAHTPTDDEREALYLIEQAASFRQQTSPDVDVLPNSMVGLWLRTASALEAALRRTEIPEPSAAPKHDESCAEWCNHCQVCGEGTRYGSRCPEHYQNQPQGEPSDAQVEFPFTFNGVTLEQDDGGLWITVGDHGLPRWLGPRALAALRAAGVGGVR